MNTYIILTTIIFIIILFSAKRINFIIIFFLSSIIYYMNAFIGKLYLNNGESWYYINENTYIVLIVNLLAIFFAYFLSEVFNKNIKFKQEDAYIFEKEFAQVVTLISIIGIISIIVSLKDFIFSNNYNKTIIMDNTNKIQEYYKMFTMFWAIYVFTNKNTKYKAYVYIVATMGLALTFLLGHRSFCVITVIAIIFDYFHRNIAKNETLWKFIAKHRKIIIEIILLIFFVFTIKGVYTAAFNRDYKLVWERLTNISYYTKTIRISEPNAILKNLNTIVKNDYRVNKNTYLTALKYIIPGLTKLDGNISFTVIYQEDLYSTTNNASTILGEAYANGGIILVAVISILICLVLMLIYNYYCKCGNQIVKTFLLLSGIDISFYIHRNSMDYVICRIRYFAYFLILLVFIKILLNSFSKKEKKVEK